ncbi:coiled-coil domain-containing protein 81-like [Trichomycterus rosablanca]|uniref:coiled-coil domain-containing protein 81-like n=1 Tax=Trichomycterus rosablanca TaxID=2290929 RepID=UPI002F35360E
MTDGLLAGVSDAERQALPTLSQLREKDVDDIWGNVSDFIQMQMSMQKGVRIPGLGLFTFSQQKLDLGMKYVLIQRPIFLLAEKLSQSHGLKQNKPLAPAGDVPVVQLNFTALSMDSPFQRDIMEGCVKEMLLLLLRAVAAQRSVFLVFRGIGVLRFRHSVVKMNFYKDFISGMDGTGTLLTALTNRPGTSISVVSGRLSCLQRLHTGNAIMFPRIPLAEPLKEEEKDDKCSLPSISKTADKQKQTEIAENQLSGRPMSGLATAKANVIIFTDDQVAKVLSDETAGSAASSQPPEGGAAEEKINKEAADCGQTCHDHTRAGQELCYVCMQRAQRNVPVYVADKRRREEREQEKVLVLAEAQKIEQTLQREQAEREQNREENKKTAAFNLRTAEKLKAKTKARPSEFEGSYIFNVRPFTPPKLLKQRQYTQELTEQVTQLKQSHERSLQEEKIIDKLQQVQLAEDLARRKAHDVKMKKENVRKLQRALDYQLEFLGPRIPARQPNSDVPVFGARADVEAAAQAEEKLRARRIYADQLNAATVKRNEVQSKRLNEQKKEKEMLQRNHKEFREDQLARHEKQGNMAALLKQSLRHGAETKRLRDLEEEVFIRSGGMLLLDQCEQYRRCFQCKRKSSNCGESNIFKDFRYIAGSRLMV